MPLHEGEIWGEITEASLERLLERKGVSRCGARHHVPHQHHRRGEERLAARSTPTSPSPGRPTAASPVASRTLNPLYVDECYAKKSMWGQIITPPATLCWTETVNGATDGFPGCHTIWRGVELRVEPPDVRR